MVNYSTREAAKLLGIHVVTLHRYILGKKVPAPKVQVTGGVKFRVWNERAIERVREILPKIANGRISRTQSKRKPERSQTANQRAAPGVVSTERALTTFT